MACETNLWQAENKQRRRGVCEAPERERASSSCAEVERCGVSRKLWSVDLNLAIF